MDELLQKKLDLALDIHSKQINNTIKELTEKVESLNEEVADLKQKVRHAQVAVAEAP